MPIYFMFKNLIEYKDLEEACAEFFMFTEGTFLRDFGPWKKGDKFDCLSFNLETSDVEEFDANNDIVKTAKFTLIVE